jgi:hypothetical protein
MLPKNNIWLILGLSGAGKSTLARYLSERLSWLLIEIDQQGDGPAEIVNNRELMQAYVDFAETLDASSLVGVVRKLCLISGKTGAIFSFRSVDIVPPAAIRQNRDYGVTIFYLVADARHCLRSFLNREQASEDPLSSRHWINNNASLLIALADPSMDEHTITSMGPDGVRKDNDVIYQAVLSQIELNRPGFRRGCFG